jgi:fumarate reductase (CoM/CoB) subunit A
MEQLKYDVLVIGSGAAGLRAAIAAASRKQKVLGVSKGPPGSGTSTSLSYGIFAGAPEEGSIERHRDLTLRAGRGINRPELVEALVQEGPSRLQELLDWGVPGVTHQGALFVKSRPLMWGRELMSSLLGRSRRGGAELVGGMTACKIWVRRGGIGTLAYSSKERQWVLIRSRSVVLATGGAAALYMRHDNPGPILGQGHLLALDAGAVLEDMEFIQFHPAGLAEAGLPRILIPSAVTDKGRLINGKHEDILSKYGLPVGTASKQARDFLSQAICREMNGGGEVWLDLRDVPDQAWKEDPSSDSIRQILLERYEGEKRPLRVAPMAHFVMGGVSIGPDGATSIPGMYAAGELAAGVHGANRMRGNALTEALVFGARAGEAAADWAKNADACLKKDFTSEVRAFLEPFEQRTVRLSSINPKRKIREILWNQAGVIRREEGLKTAKQEVEGILASSYPCCFGRGPDGITNTLVFESACRTALLIIKAALMRRESRGAHLREDLPAQNDREWLGHIRIRLSMTGQEVWSFDPAHSK